MRIVFASVVALSSVVCLADTSVVNHGAADNQPAAVVGANDCNNACNCSNACTQVACRHRRGRPMLLRRAVGGVVRGAARVVTAPGRVFGRVRSQRSCGCCN